MLRLAGKLERINLLLGTGVAWLTLAMVLLTFGIVILRYRFDLGWIWLQEIVTWMHAVVFMLAAGYTLACDEHVRVDVFYRRLSAKGRALVDASGSLLFLIPVSLFMLFGSWDYVAASWAVGESSREAGGLAYPAVPLLKFCIPLTAALLALQGLVILLRSLARLAGLSDDTGGGNGRVQE